MFPCIISHAEFKKTGLDQRKPIFLKIISLKRLILAVKCLKRSSLFKKKRSSLKFCAKLNRPFGIIKKVLRNFFLLGKNNYKGF